MNQGQVQRNASRKYRLAVISLLLITFGWLLASILPGLAQMFSELITGIMGVLMLYFTGNVGNKFVVGKTLIDRERIISSKGDSNGANS